MSIQAMKQALEALDSKYIVYCTAWREDRDKAVTALRAAITEAEKQEPFGVWHQGDTEAESDFFLGDSVDGGCCDRCIPLYTAPQPEDKPREQVEPFRTVNLNKCPNCGGPADNGHDRCYPPNPYYCTKCTKEMK